MKFLLLLLFSLVLLVRCDDDDEESLDGRIEQFDKIILQPDTLKAIAFSADDETETYKQILWDALSLIDVKSKQIKDEDSEFVDYYKYILANVIKYTNKWLTDEVVHLVDKTNDKNEAANQVSWRKRRNIAEFIYYKSGDYGVELLFNNEDLSFKSYRKNKHEEL